MDSERALWIQCKIDEDSLYEWRNRKNRDMNLQNILACISVKYKNDMDFDIKINKLACI